MKKINLFLLCLLTGFALSAQNLLKENVCDFEGKDSKWWIQHKNIFSFSDEKKMVKEKGRYSLKFIRSTNNTEKGTVKIHHKDAFKEYLKPGKYKITARVWIGHEAPNGFNFNFPGDNWLSVNVSFKRATREEWVYISKEFEVKKVIGSSVTLAVTENEKYGGYGTFYLDNLVITQLPI